MRERCPTLARQARGHRLAQALLALTIEVPFIFDRLIHSLCAREAFFNAQSCQWRIVRPLQFFDVRFTPIADIEPPLGPQGLQFAGLASNTL